MPYARTRFCSAFLAVAFCLLAAATDPNSSRESTVPAIATQCAILCDSSALITVAFSERLVLFRIEEGKPTPTALVGRPSRIYGAGLNIVGVSQSKRIVLNLSIGRTPFYYSLSLDSPEFIQPIQYSQIPLDMQEYAHAPSASEPPTISMNPLRILSVAQDRNALLLSPISVGPGDSENLYFLASCPQGLCGSTRKVLIPDPDEAIPYGITGYYTSEEGKAHFLSLEISRPEDIHGETMRSHQIRMIDESSATSRVDHVLIPHPRTFGRLSSTKAPFVAGFSNDYRNIIVQSLHYDNHANTSESIIEIPVAIPEYMSSDIIGGLDIVVLFKEMDKTALVFLYSNELKRWRHVDTLSSLQAYSVDTEDSVILYIDVDGNICIRAYYDNGIRHVNLGNLRQLDRQMHPNIEIAFPMEDEEHARKLEDQREPVGQLYEGLLQRCED